MKKLLSLSVSAVLLLMTVHFRLWGFVYVGWICMLLLVFLWVWLLWGENFLWERKLAEWFEKAINNQHSRGTGRFCRQGGPSGRISPACRKSLPDL